MAIPRVDAIFRHRASVKKVSAVSFKSRRKVRRQADLLRRKG